jgi:hypothetical protein
MCIRCASACFRVGILPKSVANVAADAGSVANVAVDAGGTVYTCVYLYNGERK